jgi:hypothetical protein
MKDVAQCAFTGHDRLLGVELSNTTAAATGVGACVRVAVNLW